MAERWQEQGLGKQKGVDGENGYIPQNSDSAPERVNEEIFFFGLQIQCCDSLSHMGFLYKM